MRHDLFRASSTTISLTARKSSLQIASLEKKAGSWRLGPFVQWNAWKAQPSQLRTPDPVLAAAKWAESDSLKAQLDRGTDQPRRTQIVDPPKKGER
jgi:hypothetical protein